MVKLFWRALSSSLSVGSRRPAAPQVLLAPDQSSAVRRLVSKHWPITSVVPCGQLSLNDCAVCPPRVLALPAVSAFAALATFPSFASLISTPPSEFFLIFFAPTVRSLMFFPLNFTAAYETPPRARTSARVAATFAYVMRGRSRRRILSSPGSLQATVSAMTVALQAACVL